MYTVGKKNISTSCTNFFYPLHFNTMKKDAETTEIIKPYPIFNWVPKNSNQVHGKKQISKHKIHSSI